MARLEQVQNESLKIVAGAAKPVARDSLRYWLGVRNVKYQQQYQAARESLRIKSSNSHPLKEGIDSREDTKVNQRLKTVQSRIPKARETVEIICPVENITCNDWVVSNAPNIKTARIVNRGWRERAGEINQSDIEHWLEGCDPDIIVATDGSIREDSTAWGGAVWMKGKKCLEWSTAREGRASSYRSECEAFGDTLVWIANNVEEQDRVVVLSDSMSLISGLEKGLILQSWNCTVSRMKPQITACYIPGHAGISYNGKADHLAGRAEVFGTLQREPSDIMTEINRRLQKAELEQEQLLYHSTQRLQERGWHYGDGRGVRLRGRERGVYTQMETGVLTITTLQSVLRGGQSEQQPAPLDLSCSRIE